MFKALILTSLTIYQFEASLISNEGQAIVFNHIQEHSVELDNVVHNIFGKQFKVIDFQDGEHHYAAPVLREGDMPKAPVTSDGHALSGYVLIVYVITEDGRAAHAMVVTETDRRLTNAALRSMNGWRFRAGVLDGKPVATTAAQEFEF